MRVVITGAGGFIGRALCAGLLARGHLSGPDGESTPITELLLVDRAPFAAPTSDSVRIRSLSADLRVEHLFEQLFENPPDTLFHLAATLTIDAERDPDSGWAINMMLPHRLLEACRRAGHTPRFIYASSIAVFGGELPETVSDEHARHPQTSYGTAKAITELLIDDYSRREFVDGRALRLPIVLIREAAATRTVSDIVAALAREPLAGRAVVSPLGPNALFPVVSVQRVAHNLILLHELPASAFTAGRAVNQPGLTVSVDDIGAALARVAGPAAAALLAIAPEPAIESVIAGWPTRFVSAMAFDPPLLPDPDFDSILRSYLKDAADADSRS